MEAKRDRKNLAQRIWRSHVSSIKPLKHLPTAFESTYSTLMRPHQTLDPACLSSLSSGFFFFFFFLISTLTISFIEDTGLTDIRGFWQKVLLKCFSLKTFAQRLCSSRISLRITFSDITLSLTQNCFFI